MTIREAINKIAFALNDSYDLYLYCLTEEEEIKEADEIEEAWQVLNQNNIDSFAIQKHIDREANVIPEPIRFIDRAFHKVETDELPF